MAWVVLVDERAVMVKWMEDKQGRQASITGKQYVQILQEKVWPEMRI